MMMRISFRSLGPWLRPTPSLLQHKSSVCSTCQALANLHRQQLRQHQQNHPQQLSHDSQQRRRLQLYSANLQRDPVVGVNKNNYKGFNFSDSWTYKGNHGVDHWAELFSRNCAGKFQSPVDLSPLNMKKDSKLRDFTFTNFDDVTDVVQELWNNGHTAQVSYLSGDLRVNGGGLRSEYRVLQFHFHWGRDNTQGSEHTISGEPYPMEMHVVTYNVDYDNFTNALNYADGLAVLGVFYEAGNFGNYDFDTLTNALPSVKTPGSTVLLDPVPLDLLLPLTTEQYYRYHGSLTSPPCSEAVTWTLFRDPVYVSDNQLKAFRGLQALERDEITNEHLPMVDNYRPTQPLHGREIKTSF